MDLIYADETGKDIGVLASYELDMAYGTDENDFTVSVGRSDHCCHKGYLIYAEGTEYGGIVDSIKVDTEDETLTYGGRTWHGILQGKIICPDAGDDYLIISGEVNAVLQTLIDRIGLSGLFTASVADTGVTVSNYQFERYCGAYTGICRMLRSVGMKLCMSWESGMITMSAQTVRDYSQDEEFDASQVNFSVERNYRPVNHIICLGQGDLRDRAVIHVFADENGGIQPYLLDPDKDPVEDSDYILDTSSQVLFDQDEVTEVYDFQNAEVTTNYVMLTEEPEDWSTNCESYYVYVPNYETVDGTVVDTGGKYEAVKSLAVIYDLQTVQPYDWTERYSDYYTYDPATGSYNAVTGGTESYTLLTSKPGNWDTGYGKYYTGSDPTYTQVTGVITSDYVLQSKVPSDWQKNYAQYYRIQSGDYMNVTGESYDTYPVQTIQPADWETNFASYYRKATALELEADSTVRYYSVTRDLKGRIPEWIADTYHTLVVCQKAPAWTSGTYYTRVNTISAPTWTSGTYYQQVGQSAPTWTSGTYYTKTDQLVAPDWASETYYRQAIDRYAVMIAGAISRIEDYNASDKLSVDLDETDRVYDVGDIVGTREEITGIRAVQEVKKKVITIQDGDIVIRYEVD